MVVALLRHHVVIEEIHALAVVATRTLVLLLTIVAAVGAFVVIVAVLVVIVVYQIVNLLLLLQLLYEVVLDELVQEVSDAVLVEESISRSVVGVGRFRRSVSLIHVLRLLVEITRKKKCRCRSCCRLDTC